MHLRHPRLSVECPVAFLGDTFAGQGTLANVSKGGWKVVSPSPVPEGSYLRLNISFPDDIAPLSVDVAAVRWSKGQEFGLEFLRMGTKEQARMGSLLRLLQSPASHCDN